MLTHPASAWHSGTSIETQGRTDSVPTETPCPPRSHYLKDQGSLVGTESLRTGPPACVHSKARCWLNWGFLKEAIQRTRSLPPSLADCSHSWTSVEEDTWRDNHLEDLTDGSCLRRSPQFDVVNDLVRQRADSCCTELCFGSWDVERDKKEKERLI